MKLDWAGGEPEFEKEIRPSDAADCVAPERGSNRNRPTTRPRRPRDTEKLYFHVLRDEARPEGRDLQIGDNEGGLGGPPWL